MTRAVGRAGMEGMRVLVVDGDIVVDLAYLSIYPFPRKSRILPQEPLQAPEFAWDKAQG